MHWFILIIAGLFEAFWAYELKCSEGFTRLVPSSLTIVGMSVSFYLLSQAMKSLPLSISYAAWTGIGIVGSTIIGILFLEEPMSVAKLVCIVLIVCGIGGLNVLSAK